MKLTFRAVSPGDGLSEGAFTKPLFAPASAAIALGLNSSCEHQQALALADRDGRIAMNMQLCECSMYAARFRELATEFAHKYWERAPPWPRRFMADADPAIGQQVFDIPW
ncbi:MAG: hypothetical protein EOP69_00800 [Spirochaetia bacterium]|nr:MAG: hypothetical protein EOP69_00800 [Spirochaetia bacterium]